MKRILQDIKFRTGGKLTGTINSFEKMLTSSIQLVHNQELWFDKTIGATLVDLSKWNGDVDWSRLWQKVHGVVYRLGYGSVQDSRFLDVAVPGFRDAPDDRYCALYQYMSTGAEKQSQIDLILESINKMNGRVNAFWIDIESAYNETTADAYYSSPNAIMAAVKKEYPTMPVGFYTNRRGWLDLKKLGDVNEWLKKYLFWLAWYPYKDTKYPTPPTGLGLSDIYMWQYSAGGNGKGAEYGVESSAIDLNITRDDKDKFLEDNVTGEVIQPPPVIDEWNDALIKGQLALAELMR